MTLRERQCLFAECIAKLITWAFSQGYQVTCGDFAAVDGHSLNSCHYIRLAADLNLFIKGVYQTTSEAHAPLGAYWKSLHPECRWGGDFKRNGKPAPDGNHYSIQYQGRQ